MTTAVPDERPTRPRTPHHLLAFLLSLPERILRQLASLAGSLLLPLVQVLPRPFRQGKFFRLVVMRQIRILTDTVGQSEIFPSEGQVQGRDMVRMGVGGAIDNLFLLTLHASPVWILLAATDVCAGARNFVSGLASELKEAGVMPEGSRLDRMDDVLVGLSRLSDRASDSLDMPPMKLAEMKKTVARIRAELVGVTRSTLRVADVEDLAHQVTALADQTKRPLLEVSAAVASGTLRTVGQVVTGALVGVRATAHFVERGIGDAVLGYRESIESLRKLGLTRAVRRFMTPLGRSRRRLFAYSFLTWTETALSFGIWARAPWRVDLAPPERSPGSPADKEDARPRSH